MLPLALVEAGVSGSLINHSEDRMPSNKISMCVALCRQHKLTSVVCAESIEKVREVAVFKPDYIAIEPPELIGSGIPVSKADPDIVRNSVQAVREVSPDTIVLCGAGISKGEDVKAALALGTSGVLLASGVVKAKDPKKALLDLVSLDRSWSSKGLFENPGTHIFSRFSVTVFYPLHFRCTPDSAIVTDCFYRTLPYSQITCNNPDLSEIEHKVKRLQELLSNSRRTSLDFDKREHLHIIQLCLDMAIAHMEKLK